MRRKRTRLGVPLVALFLLGSMASLASAAEPDEQLVDLEVTKEVVGYAPDEEFDIEIRCGTDEGYDSASFSLEHGETDGLMQEDVSDKDWCQAIEDEDSLLSEYDVSYSVFIRFDTGSTRSISGSNNETSKIWLRGPDPHSDDDDAIRYVTSIEVTFKNELLGPVFEDPVCDQETGEASQGEVWFPELPEDYRWRWFYTAAADGSHDMGTHYGGGYLDEINIYAGDQIEVQLEDWVGFRDDLESWEHTFADPECEPSEVDEGENGDQDVDPSPTQTTTSVDVEFVKVWFDADGGEADGPTSGWAVTIIEHADDDILRATLQGTTTDVVRSFVEGRDYTVAEDELPAGWDEVDCGDVTLTSVDAGDIVATGTGTESADADGVHVVCNQQAEVLAEVLEEEVEVLAELEELPRTGTGVPGLLAASLMSLAAGGLLVRRRSSIG